MELNRGHHLVYALLAGAWLVVVAWQFDEHERVVESARTNLRNRAHEITSTLSAVTWAMRFRGAVIQDKLEPVLQELVDSRTDQLFSPGGLLTVGLLNPQGDPFVLVGQTNLLDRSLLAEPEHWDLQAVTFVQPLGGASVNRDSTNNSSTVVLPLFRDLTNGVHRGDFNGRRGPRFSEDSPGGTNAPPDFRPPPTNAAGEAGPPPPDDRHRPPEEDGRFRRDNHRPPFLRWMSEEDYKTFTAQRELHGLVLILSTDKYRAACTDDWWLRLVIAFFAGVSAVGAGIAWRNMGQTAELQIRLVRASELTSHLRELNLAAAGLAHETRNPLNIIRGLAQMVSRLPEAAPEVREKTRTIVEETDKVTAQLTEFINYSRPREVRPARVSLADAAAEIVHTLGQDLTDKNLRATVIGDRPLVLADEQLLRQVLFNLLLNAIQAVEPGGNIEVLIRLEANRTATLDLCDDGPGVPPERRQEIFKPYFTTHQKGTGLGLAVVQQIVLAHGWEIQCLDNQPRGAIFRITHLKLAV